MCRFAALSAILATAGGAAAQPPPPGCDAPGPRVRLNWAEICRLPPPPPPNGYYVRGWQGAQVARAELQRSFVQRHEWTGGGTSLGPAGRRHLDRLAKSLLGGGGPVFLEPDPLDDKLTEARRLALVDSLRRYGVADAESRVAVAYPLGEGLFGDEARILYRNFVRLGLGGAGGQGGALGGIGGGIGGLGGRGLGGGGFGGLYGRGY